MWRMMKSICVTAIAMSLATQAVYADDANKARILVDRAKESLETFAGDPNMGWFRDNVVNAKAVLIIPALVKAGFIWGGSGGSGVLLARGSSSQDWTYPAFYTMGSVTFGLQIGGEVSEIVLMIMTERGVDALLASSFKLGGDISVAAGPIGAGAKVQIADILAFSRTKGLYGGINIEGAVLKIRNDWNEAYYNRRSVRPRDIIVSRSVSNAHADPLRRAIALLVN